ncbi:MAG: AAA family ATPase [Desulfovibrio sp.]
MSIPRLYIFSGMPGVGKSTLAKKIASEMSAVYLRIDTVEQAIRDLCDFKVQGEGYRLSYRIATDNLRIGLSVISDSCNPIELTRQEWQDVAVSAGAEFVNIEIICSDKGEHQSRVDDRDSEIPNLQLPRWAQVQKREYHPWNTERIVIDTAGKSVDESILELIEKIREY